MGIFSLFGKSAGQSSPSVYNTSEPGTVPPPPPKIISLPPKLNISPPPSPKKIPTAPTPKTQLKAAGKNQKPQKKEVAKPEEEFQDEPMLNEISELNKRIKQLDEAIKRTDKQLAVLNKDLSQTEKKIKAVA